MLCVAKDLLVGKNDKVKFCLAFHVTDLLTRNVEIKFLLSNVFTVNLWLKMSLTQVRLTKMLRKMLIFYITFLLL